MENWNEMVITFKDRSVFPYKTKLFCEEMFQDLSRNSMKAEVKRKFRERVGPEFDEWVSEKTKRYPEVMVTDILSDDKFWKLTIKLLHL